MFWPQRMGKIRLIGLKSNLKKTIEGLEEYGGVEIKQLSSHEIKNAKSLEENNKIVEKLLKTEAMLNALPEQKIAKKTSMAELNEFSKQSNFAKLEKETEKLVQEMNTAQNRIETHKEEKNTMKMLAQFDFEYDKLENTSIELNAGIVSGTNAEKLSEALGKKGISHSSKSIEKGKKLFLVALEKGKRSSEDLGNYGFEKIGIPKMSGKPSQELKRIDKEISELEKKKADISKELEGIAKENYVKLTALKEYLGNENAKASLPEKFLETQHSFALEAYIPEKNFAEFASFLDTKFGKKVFVENFSSETLENTHEAAPTLTEHSILVKPFESLVNFLSIPKSNELDTTMIFLVFFPIFYGMIVGDVIYGIISFLLAKWILGIVPKDGIMNPVAKIWMWGAIPTIIFGVVFDEFAGFSHSELFALLGIHGIQIYHGFERLHSIDILLPASILVGVFTIAIGFLLGFINATRHKDKKHALAKLGWFGTVLFGTITVTTAMFNAFPQEYLLPAAILLLVSLVPVVLIEGIVGIMEIPSVVGNVFSFARILAVGLVGVVIASLLNDLAFPSIDKGLLIIILIPLYIGGHLFNAFLAMFEALIQGARLNFVEFYSKFYEGGGKEFNPFKFERKFIKD